MSPHLAQEAVGCDQAMVFSSEQWSCARIISSGPIPVPATPSGMSAKVEVFLVQGLTPLDGDSSLARLSNIWLELARFQSIHVGASMPLHKASLTR